MLSRDSHNCTETCYQRLLAIGDDGAGRGLGSRWAEERTKLGVRVPPEGVEGWPGRVCLMTPCAVQHSGNMVRVLASIPGQVYGEVYIITISSFCRVDWWLSDDTLSIPDRIFHHISQVSFVACTATGTIKLEIGEGPSPGGNAGLIGHSQRVNICNDIEICGFTCLYLHQFVHIANWKNWYLKSTLATHKQKAWSRKTGQALAPTLTWAHWTLMVLISGRPGVDRWAGNDEGS